MGWTIRCMATRGGVQAGVYWEEPGRRLLCINGCAGGTVQDTGVCAVVERNIRHKIQVVCLYSIATCLL